MTTKKTTRFLFFLVLLTLVAALIWRTQNTTVNADDNLEQDVIPTETPTATATATATAMASATATATNTAEPSTTPDPQSSATPTSTATVTSPTGDNFSYLPVQAAIPPPSPNGCIPQPHIPAYSISAEQELATILNAYRQSHGQTALNVMSHLSQAARRHALDMAENDILGHIGSDDSNVGDRTHDACYEWLHIGQMIGQNENVGSMINSWTATKGNRDLILSSEYIDFGMAYVYDPDSLYEHYWVVVFGRHQSAGQLNE